VKSLKNLIIFVLLLTAFANGTGRDTGQVVEKDGKLVVLVTWGDDDNTPATNVYVEAYGFVRKHGSKKSFILNLSRPGRYEASLPPGVYDVFVSEGTSIPRCKRVLISPGFTGYWTLKLEIDDIYTEKSGVARTGGPR
jgi:hypothetical protein